MSYDDYQQPRQHARAYDNYYMNEEMGPEELNLNSTTTYTPGVGPGTYTPNDRLLTKTIPNVSFGRQHRFLGHKVGFISPRHQSDLLCTASQGPKYNVEEDPTKKKGPAFSFGPRRPQFRKPKNQTFRVADTSGDLGPAAYKPKDKIIHKRAPRTSFGTAARFPRKNPFFNNHLAKKDTDASSKCPPPNAYLPNTTLTGRSSPRYSFGGHHLVRNRYVQQYTNRASFLTHSVKGGLARPATMECNLGPGDYTPRDRILRKKIKTPTFAKCDRFQKSGLQFISASHSASNVGAGPGPKYYNKTRNCGYKPKSARSKGLNWL